MSRKTYKYYFFDEQNDDFANNGIESKPTPKEWVYLPSNVFYRIFKSVVYYVCLTIFVFCLFFMGIKLKNKKSLKNRKNKKDGYFIYGNHTGWFMDAVSGPVAAYSRQCYTIVNSDSINIKGIRWLLKCLGAYPTPSSPTGYVNFVKGINKAYQKGNPIVIYPEAHIWPRYNKIRDFTAVSFNYPAKLGAPCFAKTTVYKKRKNGTTHPVIYFDGPVYPDMSLPLKERQADLADKIKNLMKSRVEECNSAADDYHIYLKAESKEEVRTEIEKIKKSRID